MKRIKTTFESFLNEGSDAENVQNLIDAKAAAPELVKLSGELLSPEEFGEYLESYYEDPKGFDIDPRSKYYAAIVSAYEDISNETTSPKWQSVYIEKSDFYKEYIKLKNKS